MDYKIWLEKALGLHEELAAMSASEIEDAFYKDLEFGTGGLRGVIGAGTDRMNVYTVAKASQGLADYINLNNEKGSIAVSYDSRIKSEEFAKVAAGVFAANGIKVYIFKELMPTPCLSYATRALNCSAGIMITASHNPSVYNGYKVYGSDGCQITLKAAEAISYEINKLDIFADINRIPFDEAYERGSINYIDDSVYTGYINAVKSQLFNPREINRDIPVVYSPLNGTGLKPVLRALRESGFCNINVVTEQEKPDGNFPTCPFPNPELKDTMSLAINLAIKSDSELAFATDPDCDRIGVAVKKSDGFVLLSGNEIGALLFDYICLQRVSSGNMPKDAVVIKTIVTGSLIEKIAEYYKVRVINVLTGFKYIGEQIGCLEKESKESSFIFGLEESCGYLSGTYVRDKDAVNAASLICEMFAFYKAKGITLIERMEQLYASYGYCLNTLHSYEFDGASGFNKMQGIMKKLRDENTSFGALTFISRKDYLNGINGLPKSDVLQYESETVSVTVRPSGTEPKIKMYVSVFADDKKAAEALEKETAKIFEQYIC